MCAISPQIRKGSTDKNCNCSFVFRYDCRSHRATCNGCRYSIVNSDSHRFTNTCTGFFLLASTYTHGNANTFHQNHSQSNSCADAKRNAHTHSHAYVRRQSHADAKSQSAYVNFEETRSSASTKQGCSLLLSIFILSGVAASRLISVFRIILCSRFHIRRSL